MAGTDIVGSGSYGPKEGRMFGMALWTGDGWTTLKDAALTAPIRLIATPTINGTPDVQFICDDLARDLALRIT